jgi:hypothetical protein
VLLLVATSARHLIAVDIQSRRAGHCPGLLIEWPVNRRP